MKLVGYNTHEVMGHSLVKEFITDDFKTAVQTVLDRALSGEETANFGTLRSGNYACAQRVT